MTDTVEIYVELLDKAVETWRPVAAVAEGDGVFRLLANQPKDESWAFPPGSRVRCEVKELSGGAATVAVALAD